MNMLIRMLISVKIKKKHVWELYRVKALHDRMRCQATYFRQVKYQYMYSENTELSDLSGNGSYDLKLL